MTKEEYISSPKLSTVIFNLIHNDINFRDYISKKIPGMESYATTLHQNPGCSCRFDAANLISQLAVEAGSALYDYTEQKTIHEHIEELFQILEPIFIPENISGKVIKTTIDEWPEFAKSFNNAGYIYQGMFATMSGQDVYIFFL